MAPKPRWRRRRIENGIIEGLWGYGWVSAKAFQIMPVIFATMIFVWMLWVNPDFHFFGKKAN